MIAAPEASGPALSISDALRWIRTNLLSTWYNAVLTVVIIAVLFLSVKGIGSWVLFTADWSAVTSNLKLFLVGQYPSDETWRVGLVVLTTMFFMGLSWSVWGGVARTFALALAVGLGATSLLPPGLVSLDLGVRLWLIAHPVAIMLGYSLGRMSLVRPRWVVMGWLLSFLLTLIILRGFHDNAWLPFVSTNQWGGLLLTFLLALVGIVASFPLGVLLALGRRSNLPVVKVFSILFIEAVRGVPLVSLLFMTQIIVPLFLPEGMRMDRVIRALVAITLFSSAYMAENVRGGLQAVPMGQVEAARALGLSGRNVMLFIVLPQALRAVIPTIVGQFISLFKDTSLVVIVGMLDIVGIGKSIILGNVQWFDSQREVYLFLAVVFWVFTYSMSYASRKLETALGVGER